MKELNIFEYSIKELTTDAFLKYLLLWSDREKLNNEIANKLLLKESDQNEVISICKVKLQKSYGRKKLTC